ETPQIPLFPYHPMARDDDGEGIAAGSGARRADGLGRTGPFGQGAVADRFSIRDAADLPPDPRLEIGAGEAQRQDEIGSFSGEIFLKLPGGLPKDGMFRIELPAAVRGREVIAADKIK